MFKDIYEIIQIFCKIIKMTFCFHNFEAFTSNPKYSYKVCTKCLRKKVVDLTPGYGYQPIREGWKL